jgi:hypothetical protein
MTGGLTTRQSAGALLGAALAAVGAWLIRPLFDPPTGGVGFVTVNAYPKGWDYAVIALLIAGSAAGAWLAGRRSIVDPSGGKSRGTNYDARITAVAVFFLMLLVHDHPFQHMDPFHEGEHLTPAWLMLEGERPFGDVFLLHGLGVDGGLDALAGARPLHTRRLQTVLDALTLALLVPIAAEVTATLAGMLGAVFLSLCGVAAFWLPVFPYFRLLPVLLVAWGMLVFARTRRWAPLALAFASATLGLLWSLDTGTYALAGAAVLTSLLCRREEARRAAGIAAIASALPFLVMLVLRADIGQFVRDSFVVIPSAIDAVWSLPAPKPFTAAGVRYYVPPVLYGLLLAIGWKRRDPRILILVILSIFLFRTAAGRVSWSHTRFAVPLLGIMLVAFLLEPLKNRLFIALASIAALFYFEVPQNLAAGAKLVAGWPTRQGHEGLVRHPLVRGIYTTEDNATQLATLKGYVDALGPGTILDFTNERALYFLLRRKPPARVFDVPMLAAPALKAETMAALRANPPLCVILGGEPAVAVFDGVPNDQRVPELARWIETSYPRRTQIGRFLVATR